MFFLRSVGRALCALALVTTVGCEGRVLDEGSGATGSGGQSSSSGSGRGSDPLWSKQFGDSAVQFATSVAVDSADAIALTGSFGGVIDLGGGPLKSTGYDLFLAKFDGHGDPLWSNHFGVSDGEQFGSLVGFDANGDLVLSGALDGTVDYGLGPLTSGAGVDAFVAKFDALGQPIFAKHFGNSTADVIPYGMAVDPSGLIALTGGFGGSVDFGAGALTNPDPNCVSCADNLYVAVLDPAGNAVWSKSIPSAQAGKTNAIWWIWSQIGIDANRDVILAGNFFGAFDFGDGPVSNDNGSYDNDVFVVKLDASGTLLWHRQFSESSHSSLAVDAAGDIAITGTFQGTLDFESGALTSPSAGGYFVAELDGDGHVLWGSELPGGDAGSTGAIAFDADANVITGLATTQPNGEAPADSAGLVVTKFDPKGQPIASAHFSSDPPSFSATFGFGVGPVSIAAYGSHDVLLGGGFQNDVDFGTGHLVCRGGTDAFLAKTRF